MSGGNPKWVLWSFTSDINLDVLQHRQYGIIALTVVSQQDMNSTIFWGVTPCSLLKVSWRFGGTYRLHLQGESSWQAEAICSSETSVDFHQTTWRYIPEDRTLHNHRCENLKSCTAAKHVHPTLYTDMIILGSSLQQVAVRFHKQVSSSGIISDLH
jgi:hypothetical protein